MKMSARKTSLERHSMGIGLFEFCPKTTVSPPVDKDLHIREYIAANEIGIIQAHYDLHTATGKTGNDLTETVNRVAALPFAPLVFHLPGSSLSTSWYSNHDAQYPKIGLGVINQLYGLSPFAGNGYRRLASELEQVILPVMDVKIPVPRYSPKTIQKSPSFGELRSVTEIYKILKAGLKHMFSSSTEYFDQATELRGVIDPLLLERGRYSWETFGNQKTYPRNLVSRAFNAFNVNSADNDSRGTCSLLTPDKYPHLYDFKSKNIIKAFDY